MCDRYVSVFPQWGRVAYTMAERKRVLFELFLISKAKTHVTGALQGRSGPLGRDEKGIPRGQFRSEQAVDEPGQRHVDRNDARHPPPARGQAGPRLRSALNARCGFYREVSLVSTENTFLPG